MKRSNPKQDVYHTPTLANIMVNAFHQWLDMAADMTRGAGLEQTARLALGDVEDVYKNKCMSHIMAKARYVWQHSTL